MAFHQFTPADGSEPFGSFEVFYDIRALTLTGKEVDAGFYWQSGFPGCLPDSSAFGPFQTEAEAIADANAC